MTMPFQGRFAKIKNRAFTLIELIVTIAIFALMTALIMARYGSFDQGTLLTSLAYDIALTVRTAQTYGVSVKTTQLSANDFSSGYGVEFDLSSPQQFVLYSDASAGERFSNFVDVNAGDIVSTYNIKRGARITAICVANSTQKRCTTDQSAQGYSWYSGYVIDATLSKIDIEFVRPNPDPLIYRVESATQLDGPYTDVKIIVQSADDGGQRVIDINQTGQISVGLN